ncbi:MAG: NADH:ubiquinone reductase (Na(+)-transporting) subunit C [Muribaculaceae bacterium]|nr:NADH:ubiquinone reductase (Na(+)-transporting) subunit C [Muribaculaceae bacterium]
MNKNSNIYQIVYASVMVLVVGVALAFIYMALKPKQDVNIANDKRSQILASLHIVAPSEGELPATYEKYVTRDLLVDREGNIVDSTRNVAFEVDMKKNIKLAEADRQLPVLECTLDDGSKKYVIPVRGAGLWGPIWGFVAVDADGSTIYGANFSHEGETPGLGARITEDEFQQQFAGKQVFKEGAFKSVSVMKKGQVPSNGSDHVDAISGATITSRGVGAMMQTCIAPYEPFLKKLSGATANPS